MEKKEKELVQLHCGHCGFKTFSNGSALSLAPVAYAQPPARADGKAKDTRSLGSRFKCPQCGYVVKAFKLPPAEPTDMKKPDPDRKIGIDERLHRPPPDDKDFFKQIDATIRGKNGPKRIG